MEIPSEIKIGPHLFTVEIEGDVHNWNGNLGETITSTNRIKISDRIPQSRKEETFIHEVFHNVFRQQGLHTNPNLKDHEEEICESLSNGFYQVLKENNLRFK